MNKNVFSYLWSFEDYGFTKSDRYEWVILGNSGKYAKYKVTKLKKDFFLIEESKKKLVDNKIKFYNSSIYYGYIPNNNIDFIRNLLYHLGIIDKEGNKIEYDADKARRLS